MCQGREGGNERGRERKGEDGSGQLIRMLDIMLCDLFSNRRDGI